MAFTSLSRVFSKRVLLLCKNYAGRERLAACSVMFRPDNRRMRSYCMRNVPLTSVIHRASQDGERKRSELCKAGFPSCIIHPRQRGASKYTGTGLSPSDSRTDDITGNGFLYFGPASH